MGFITRSSFAPSISAYTVMEIKVTQNAFGLFLLIAGLRSIASSRRALPWYVGLPRVKLASVPPFHMASSNLFGCLSLNGVYCSAQSQSTFRFGYEAQVL